MPLPRRAPDPALNPEIERLLYQVQVVVEEAHGLFHGLSDQQMRWSPSPAEWSIAQNIDHLNRAAAVLLTSAEAAIQKARASGKLHDGPFVYGFLSRYLQRSMLPPVKRRFQAVAKLQPPLDKPVSQVLEEWASQHERQIAVFKQASGVDLARVKVPSPVLSWVRYSLGISFWILTSHEKRHLWQARNVRNHPSFPK